MKKIITIACILVASNGHAQTYDEWFRQKKTQIQYLLDQIAANEIYIGYAEKGYKIAQDGLTAIGDIKTGEFNLHLDFFNSLKSINPAIKNYVRIADIMQRQLQIISIYKNSYKSIRASGQFTPKEINYFYSVFTKLLGETTAGMDELLQLITANQYAMKDDERMKRIDDLYTDMESKYGFAKSFSNEAQLLSLQRINEKSEAEISQSLYNIK
jgi:hypothetical protein